MGFELAEGRSSERDTTQRHRIAYPDREHEIRGHEATHNGVPIGGEPTPPPDVDATTEWGESSLLSSSSTTTSGVGRPRAGSIDEDKSEPARLDRLRDIAQL